MTDDAGDYVLGEDVLSDLWLLLEPLAEEVSHTILGAGRFLLPWHVCGWHTSRN